MRILLAEDDRDLARAVCAILKRSGYQVEHADNGDDALQMAMTEAYDGIILDWMMLGQDGIAVLRKLRQKGFRTPCMMLTARETVNDRITGLDAGADDYLPKPFDIGESAMIVIDSVTGEFEKIEVMGKPAHASHTKEQFDKEIEKRDV